MIARREKQPPHRPAADWSPPLAEGYIVSDAIEFAQFKARAPFERWLVESGV